MKKQFLFLIFVGILCFNLVSAGNNVIYNAYYAEINEDGSVNYTDASVSDFQTVGYTCLNSNCSFVGNKVNGLTKTASGNSVTLNFPDSSDFVYYGVWFYKAGYIHWETMPSSKGSGETYGPYNVYLLRKAVGWAPIMDMHVVNEVHPDTLVEVGLNVSIDADTYAAIENAGPLKYNPSELDSINLVNTNVTLKIKDSFGNILSSEVKPLSIPYSESQEVVFNYSGFSQTGAYNIELSTEVSDDKILNSLSQLARTEIRVIPIGLVNYSYSLISGLSINPVSPEKDEDVDFGFN